MNDPSLIPPTDEESPLNHSDTPMGQIESLVRRHPIVATLATVGFGCAIGVVARELLAPPPPRRRALQLLEEIQSRLSEFTEPLQDRADHLAQEGVTAVKRKLNSASCSKLGSRLSHLFS